MLHLFKMHQKNVHCSRPLNAQEFEVNNTMYAMKTFNIKKLKFTTIYSLIRAKILCVPYRAVQALIFLTH